MDTNRMKKTAEWFYSTVFKDESIRPRPTQPAERIPSLIRAARSLENTAGSGWQSRESVFLKQAKLLVHYEDDYDYRDSVVRYYPTYQSLTDPELRGYFSWRTKLRKGDVCKTSLSYAFLYIYELINQIGVSDPMDGYQKLTDFRDAYSRLDKGILPYLDRWIPDYMIYYGIDAGLLPESRQIAFDRSITVLEHIQDQPPEKVMYAIRQLSPKWLDRSRFYAEFREDFEAVTVRVLRRVSDHYASRCKKTMVEQYFGPIRQYQVQLFDTAVFCDPLKKRNCEYALDERCIYRCKNGFWTVTKHACPLRPNAKLGVLLKTIDAIMREEYAYGHPVRYETDTKWILKIIREETQALLAEKKAAEAKILRIDYTLLSRIRREAAITQEKLTVEEEAEEELPDISAQAKDDQTQPVLPAEPVTETDCPLDPTEYRLMQCLLYGGDLRWVSREGYLLSVLLDSINDKLYDIFLDSVLDDTPEPVEDYIDDLKEMISP